MIPPRNNAVTGLKQIKPITDSIIFISSTSVFGKDGRFNELSKTCPETKNGLILQQCEEFIQQHFLKWAIIRPGGLIDEQRHPLRWFSSTSVVSDCDSIINLIHTEDVARFIYRVINSKSPNKTFHLTTNEHQTKRKFYQSLFSHFKLAPPQFKEGKNKRDH